MKDKNEIIQELKQVSQNSKTYNDMLYKVANYITDNYKPKKITVVTEVSIDNTEQQADNAIIIENAILDTELMNEQNVTGTESSEDNELPENADDL